jgi:hypothetical protein
MKFDNATLQILKNYSTINHAILFQPGNVISTISSSKTVMAKATIEQTIPSSFAIYELSKFLATLSLFNDPDLKIEENRVVISEGKRKINYTFCDPSTIVVPPSKEIKFPEAEISFHLKADELTELTKALSVLSLPEVAITSDGENIFVTAVDSKNPSADSYSVQVGENPDNTTFNMIIKADYLRLIPSDYEVAISSKGLSHFKSNNIEYWIAVESTSSYGN